MSVDKIKCLVVHVSTLVCETIDLLLLDCTMEISHISTRGSHTSSEK